MKRVVRATFMALGMFTALPLPWRPWDEADRALMIACLPIAGAVVGLLWVALAMLARWLLPGCAAALIAALPWLLTGFIHLDGFMDTSDALLSWRPLEERLRILKDAHTGAFAVIAMAVLALFSYDAAAHLPFDLRALLFVSVISRCCSSFFVMTLRPIGHSQYAGLQENPGLRLAVVAMWLIAMVACAAWVGGVVLVLAVETLAYVLAMLASFRALKGVSGDTAGFALSIAECAALATLANMAA